MKQSEKQIQNGKYRFKKSFTSLIIIAVKIKIMRHYCSHTNCQSFKYDDVDDGKNTLKIGNTPLNIRKAKLGCEIPSFKII